MAELIAYEWFRPKLQDMIREAAAADIAADVSVAVITDLINGPDFSVGPVVADDDWNKDIGEPDHATTVTSGAELRTPGDGNIAASWPTDALRQV